MQLVEEWGRGILFYHDSTICTLKGLTGVNVPEMDQSHEADDSQYSNFIFDALERP